MSSEVLLIGVAETAKVLGISRPTVYQLARRADFPSMKIGTKVLVNRIALEQWVKDQVANKAEVELS